MVVNTPQPGNTFLHGSEAASVSRMNCQECGKRLRVIRGSSIQCQLLVRGALVATSVSTCPKRHIFVVNWRSEDFVDGGPHQFLPGATQEEDGQDQEECGWLSRIGKAGRTKSGLAARTLRSWADGKRLLRRMLSFGLVLFFLLRYLFGIENGHN